MHSQLQTMQIGDIGQLRGILHDMAQENGVSIKQYLQGYLSNQNQLVRGLSQQCMQQIQRKHIQLSNLIQFSLHLLQSIQHKQQALTITQQRVCYLQQDLQKINSYNVQLIKRLEHIQQENILYVKRQQEKDEVISKLEQESRCYYLQDLSFKDCQSNYDVKETTNSMMFDLRQGNKGNLFDVRDCKSVTFDDLYQLQGNNSLVINKVNSSFINHNNSNHNHMAYTQRTPALNQQLITLQEHHEKLSVYKSSIDTKSLHINNLQKQLFLLHSQISSLNNQLNVKQSQMQLSQIYFKEKLEIAQSKLLLKSHQHQKQQFNQHDIQAIFKRELARVESIQSIHSVNRTQENQYDPFNNVTDLINQECAQSHYQRNPHIRRSLMQQFVTDFIFEAQQQNVYSSQIIHSDSFSDIQDSTQREIKKTISVSTTDFKNMLSKGVQTINNEDKIITRKTQMNKYLKKNTLHDDSFLGSVASMFTKKIQPKQNYNQNKFLKQQTNKQASFFDTSIGTMFKGIYDYATKKIVTDRIQKKKSKNGGNLNNSFLDELKPMKKSGYHKGMK